MFILASSSLSCVWAFECVSAYIMCNIKVLVYVEKVVFVLFV